MQKPKSFIASGLAVALVLSVSATVHGTDYTIGDPARGANNYDSLEAMRLANVVPADGDTITLYVDDRSLTYNWYVALSNDAVITVKSSDGTERIIGMGQHTGFIDDGGILNFNNIGNNVTLNLENVRFDGNKIEGNYYGTQGGAIYSAGSLVIQGESVVFSDNSVKENGAYNYTANGGAIYVEDDLTFSDGSYVFTQNTATGDEGIHAGYGGAVYAEENILFENGTYEFSGNSAIAGDGEQSGYGGAIFSDSGRIDFIDGTYLFSNNSAVGGAGYETGSGGAVWGDYLTFKNGTYTFSANTAVAGTGDESGFGGAVMAQYNLTFENGTYLFTGNSTIGGDGTYAGVGGAIWTNDLLVFQGGNYVFHQNSAIGGNGDINGNAGAVYANGVITFQNGTYLFSENFATGQDDEFSARGGAIFNNYGLYFEDGTYRFIGNYVRGGSGGSSAYGGAIGSMGMFSTTGGEYVFMENFAKAGTGDNSAYGGAVYARGAVDLQNGTLTFTENSAIGGNGDNSGYGGAVYSNTSRIGPAVFMISGGTQTFTGNTALGGAGDYSGYGGAIFASSDVVSPVDPSDPPISSDGVFTISGGTQIFTDNKAIGGSGDYSGYGGAIYSANHQQGIGDFTISGGTQTFTRNSALGGENAVFSGLGGAIYAGATNTSISDVSFFNNSALTYNASDPTSGRGGAIFVDAKSASNTFTLSATSGNSVLFRGNTQGDASNPTPNGIAFGTTATGSGTNDLVATFDVDGHFDPVHDFNLDSSILMYDPIESQGSLADHYDIDLDIHKTGSGLWLLAGESNLDSAATFTVDEGHFWLYRWSSLNLNHDTTADVIIKDGAWFHPTIQNDGNVSTIYANTFTAEEGARMKTVGLSTLSVGDHTLKNAIVVSDSAGSSVGSTFFYAPPSTGTMFDTAKYVYNTNTGSYDLVVTDVKNMHEELGADPFWDIYRKMVLSDEERSIFDWIYELGVLRDLPDPGGYTGTDIVNFPHLKRTDAMMFRNLLLDRMCVCRCCVMPDKRELWATVTQTWADVDGATYRPTALTFGSDRQAGHWHYGIAGQYLNGCVRKEHTIIARGRSENLALGLYAGHCGHRGYVKGLMQFAAGWNDVDTYYPKSDDAARGDFSSATLGMSIELGRTFRLGGIVDNPLTITPHVGADYLFINCEAFDERGSNFQRSFGSMNYGVMELPFGVRLTKTYAFDGEKLNWLCPNVDIAYVRSVGDGAASTSANYLSMPTESWRVSGTNLGRDMFRMNLGLNGRLWNRVDTGLSYQLETRDKYDSHQLNASAALKW